MLRYIGKGFIRDIPARDLTEAEAEKYGIEGLVRSGLYEEVTVEKPHKKKLKETVEQADEDSAEVENERS